MTIKVDFSKLFIKELDRLTRKYPRVTDQVDSLIDQLEQDEHPGDKIPNVGYDVYKVRLKNPSAGRGKSGGFRVIYYIRTATFIILVTIYSKSQQEDKTSISDEFAARLKIISLMKLTLTSQTKFYFPPRQPQPDSSATN